MEISKQFDLVKIAYEEFKVFVVQQATQHPIAAIAMAILFPITIVASCVWGIRKVIILNKSESKPKPKKTPVVKPNLPLVKPKTTLKPIAPAEIWDNRYIALGGLAALGLGIAIYCCRQAPAEMLKVKKYIPNPFQSSIDAKISSIYNIVIENVQKSVCDVGGTIPNALQFSVTDLNLVSQLNEDVTNNSSLINAIKNITPCLTNLTKYIPPPFQTPLFVFNNPSSIGPAIEKVVALGSKNPVLETAVKIVRTGIFSLADNFRLAATEAVLLGVLYDKLFSRKPVSKILTSSIEAKRASQPISWHSLGVVGGSLVGTIANMWHNLSVFENKSMICTPIKASSYLAGINFVQQSVTKVVGLGYNLIPGAIVLVPAIAVTTYKILFSKENEFQINARKVEIGSMVVDLTRTALMSGISVVCKQALKWNRGSFNPSGHIMLKAAGLYGMHVSQKYIKDPMTRSVFNLFGLYSIVTDSLFTANTAGCHHSPLDIVGGIIWAVGAATLANRTVDYTMNFFKGEREKPENDPSLKNPILDESKEKLL